MVRLSRSTNCNSRRLRNNSAPPSQATRRTSYSLRRTCSMRRRSTLRVVLSRRVAFSRKRDLIFPRHPGRRENDNAREVGLEDFQSGIDPAFVGDDDANRPRRLAARFALGAHRRVGQTEANIIVREGAASDEDGVAQRTLAQKVKLVFARSEIDWRKGARGDFAVDGHGKGGGDKRARPLVRCNVGGAFVPRWLGLGGARLRRARWKMPLHKATHPFQLDRVSPRRRRVRLQLRGLTRFR